MTLNDFQKMGPKSRLKFAQENEAWLDTLNVFELEEVGRLLCHASPQRVREECPIERDLTKKDSERFKQDLFERSLFGTMQGDTVTELTRDEINTAVTLGLTLPVRGELPVE